MGIDQITATLREFGYGEPTGIDLAKDEGGGLLPSRDWKGRTYGEDWYLGDTINMSIGQGFLLVTPLQMAIATATLAMSGQRWQPHVLLGWTKPSGNFSAYIPKQLPPFVANPKVWRFIHTAMQTVTTRGTASPSFSGAHYTLGAKTGTVQVVSLEAIKQNRHLRRSSRFREHSVLIAFAPLKKPSIAGSGK